MTDPAELRLPAALVPRDGRFGSGPSKVRPEALAALAATGTSYLGTSHRREGVRSVVRRIREGLAELFELPAGYEVLMGNGGSTTFWDALAFGMIEARSAHVVIGEFSSKFAAVTRAAPFLADPVVTEYAPGTTGPVAVDSSVDLYALIHNETSTGVMSEIVRPDDGPAIVAVDGTSGAGGLRVDPTQFDVYYFAPQKALAAEGGLWLACCSPAAVERIERLAASDRWVPPSLDLALALENSRLDQTYNTPALATILLAKEQVEWINGNGGLAWSAGRCEASASTIYGWAEAHELATPFVKDPAMRSNVVATIDLDDRVDASVVCGVLRANGVVDTDPYRKLGRNQLRVAMFPAIEPDDVKALTACIEFVVEQQA